MNILFSFLFILCAVYGLYRVSEKQIRKTLQSKWALLAYHPRIVRVICLFLLVIATLLIIQEDGYSIGFISFWVFSSPLIFIFILYINELSAKQK
ncbi:hypothetical protein B9T24_14275 [Acinetobacter sp. ANC 4654]|uniref:hypothetical protein n=1 Tax=Acinetobacter sp. ANC 4654 TaxID=1977872 RepID=UPI000A33CCFE|nr:hypothetical protein [Acinetobacter sp. ANC 4654]OTG93631.1 hypothetical protein B9T24_14275 [Acinetobacter sp. ANC 4654]